MQTKLLRLIDCILRSASTSDDRDSLEAARAILAELADNDLAFAAWKAADATNSVESSADWDQTLRRLVQLVGSSDESACVRQAAHTALRLRQLQTRYSKNVEAAKLEAIYQFAYGLSHELNNPLANIATRAGLLIRSCEHADQLHLLQAISDNAMRGCEMLGDLMLVARPPKLHLATFELEKLRELVLDRSARATALRQIRFNLTWQVAGRFELDEALVLEVFWCLLRNAIEASEVGGLVQATVTHHSDQLKFQIDDDGPGLSCEALKHCFDPYYSGREAGRGLGLGLSKAKRFALMHGGDVTLENRPIRGCRATFLIPV